jgi:hypothetical protein
MLTRNGSGQPTHFRVQRIGSTIDTSSPSTVNFMFAELRQSVITKSRHSVCKDRRRQQLASHSRSMAPYWRR